MTMSLPNSAVAAFTAALLAIVVIQAIYTSSVAVNVRVRTANTENTLLVTRTNAPSKAIAATAADSILLEDFAKPLHEWTILSDPVMGGRSKAKFTIENGVGLFKGRVKNVPYLFSPGFVSVQARDNNPYPDVSSCTGLQFLMRSDDPAYKGYRVSFGSKHAKGGKHARGFKANLPNNVTEEFTLVELAFTSFTDYWNELTGDPVKTCSSQHPQYCPDVATLQNMKPIGVWGEGVRGKVSLQIKSIYAVGCFASTN
jgi:hypothetical protein